MAKPEWWNDEELKALSAKVERAAPDDVPANEMRAIILSGLFAGWEEGPRSAAELKKAATHFDRAAALHTAPAMRASFADKAASCRRRADAV